MFKYIMLEHNNRKMPIIFPKDMIHSDVADAMIMAAGRQEPKGTWMKVCSAGFVSIGPAGNILGFAFTAYGESETLGIKSNPEDSLIITNFPYAHGFPDALIPCMLGGYDVPL